MPTSRTKTSVTLLLLFVLIIPIVQIGVVSGSRGSSPGVGNQLPKPPSRPPSSPRPSIPPKPSQPIARPNPPPVINQPTARPPISAPTARPTFSLPSFSVSFTRSIGTSFSLGFSSWTGISFTRTYETSYTIAPTFTYVTSTTNWYGWGDYWHPGMGFYHYGYNYSPTTGSFTLGQTLYDQYGRACLYYDYFEFNAPTGLNVKAQVWTTGPSISYIIVPVSILSQFQNPASCSAIGYFGQAQTIGSTSTIINWTSPQDGQYAIIFFSTTPYGNTLYFVPQ